ncbi:RNA polymerase sigma-70 factor (ECF subfamily) [Paenibacillus shirakamiensis]|uniref:RNA polymerase sigma-70 factor (ECF subfamily) n=1 Tax=Paenibacillus shirakamiensis TaxID=1265935 RepID=A0ABS4JCE9_9BACL|nr:sigma-70 family RNA polymerase sigma factor [Paenibacillus shirakamiensis]MBP1999397.1 RNA polymerase sigma-70 factor (ECF subfamily) [Paenibacillus shirakamiensis]
MSESIDDKLLMRRIADKDAQALEQLYDRYERVVYSFAFRIVNDAMAAEEVVQELFMRIWNHAERYDDVQGKLSTWMFSITRNIGIDLLRKKSSRMQAASVENEVLVAVADTSKGTAEIVEGNWEGKRVKEAVDGLTAEQKTVIESIYFQGLTQQEVSDRYQIPLGTVKSRIRLAMKQLQRHLADVGRRERIHE